MVLERRVSSMKLLTPSKAIAALEDYVIKPNLTLYPTLGVVIKTDSKDSPDYIYLRAIEKKAASYGANVEVHEVDNYSEAASAIQAMRHNYRISGIIILSYFGTDADRALANMIPSRLDIDCVASHTFGHLVTSNSPVAYRYGPCAAVAVVKLLEYEGITDFAGLKIAVIGRSLRVGRPLVEMLTKKNGTVTCFHSQSLIKDELHDYDIIISAVGQPKVWGADKIGTDNKYLIDVGINTDENGSVCGDFDFDSFRDTNANITPVPGCIGKLATIVLFSKLYTSAAYSYGEPNNV